MFYRQIQMSNSTIELTTIISCVVVKFYGLMRNDSEGELTVIYTPLVVVGFSCVVLSSNNVITTYIILDASP